VGLQADRGLEFLDLPAHGLVVLGPPGGAEGATVEVMAEVLDGWVLVKVCDRGAGLPVADRERLFEPFFTTKPVGAGTGLGLAVALGLAEQNGGRLTLVDRPGGGAEARLELPLVREDVP
jgi:signal transduction histidine kinase